MTNIETIIDNMVEVNLVDQANFLKVAETLTRMGIANRDKKLYQSCHILQKRGKYYIVHFKELLMLDGRETNYNEEDEARRNKIAALLEQWNLVKVLDNEKIKNQVPLSKIKVIHYTDKDQWTLVPKYRIGNRKKKADAVNE